MQPAEMPATHAAPLHCLPQVTVASVEDSLEVVCARQTKLVADKAISECTGESWDLIALPVGGRQAGEQQCLPCDSGVCGLVAGREGEQ